MRNPGKSLRRSGPGIIIERKKGAAGLVIYGARGEPKGERELAGRLLELAAAEHWGLSPLPALVRRPRGKPEFPGLEGREFNLSHSGGIVLCALDERPVGVDVQALREGRPALVRRVFSEREREWMEGRPDKKAAFTALWALKECRAKESGEGLYLNRIAGLSVPLPEGEGPWLLDGLWFRVYEGENWRGAACGAVPPPEEIIWRN